MQSESNPKKSGTHFAFGMFAGPFGRDVIHATHPFVVVEGENGRYVPPGDSSALSSEIRQLLSRPQEAVRLGANGRNLVESQMSLDLYVQRLAGFLHEAIESEGGRRTPTPRNAASA